MKLGIGLLLLCIHLTSSIKLELQAESVDRNNANVQSQSPKSTLVNLSKFQDYIYYAKVTLGKNQTFNVLMDTESSTFWVASKYGDDSVTKANLNTYDRKSSATYKPVNEYTGHIEMEQIYETGTVHGLFASDELQVGEITVGIQPFAEVVHRENFSKELNKFDGFMGLGIPDNNPDFRILSVISNLIDKKLIEEPLVSFFFNRNTKDNVGGEVTFGSIGTTKYKNEISYVPLSNNPEYVKEAPQYWATDIERINLNGTDIYTGKVLAVVSSTTSLIRGPENVVKNIYTSISNTIAVDDNFTYPCKDAVHLPTVTFVIYGKEFALKGENYTIKCSTEDENKCCVGIAGYKSLVGWMLGRTFLGNFLSVFHYGKRQIGLAELA